MQSIRVQVTACCVPAAWYANLVGNDYRVIETRMTAVGHVFRYRVFEVLDEFGCETGQLLLPSDCRVLN